MARRGGTSLRCSLALAACALFALASGLRMNQEAGDLVEARDVQDAGRPVEVGIEVVNDTPYDIEDLIVVHKFFGKDKRDSPYMQEFLFHDLMAQSLSDQRNVTTGVGPWVWREDWWFLTWRFRPGQDGSCPWKKEDGACELWITNPKNQFGVFWVDPVSYVMISAGIANVAVTALSMGTSVILGAAATGWVAQLATGAAVAGEKTDGFKACGINSKDYENSNRKGQPLRLRIFREFAKDQLVILSGSSRRKVQTGTVGSIVKVLSSQRMVVEFAPKSLASPVQLQVHVQDLRHTFQVGQEVTFKGVRHTHQGTVIRAKRGFLEVHGSGQARSASFMHKPEDLTSKETTHRYGVEWLLFEPDAPVPTPKHLDPTWRDKFVRWECDTHGLAIADASTDAASEEEGREVKLKIINRSGKRIQQWSVVHKFNGLKRNLHIVDSKRPLPNGKFSAGPDIKVRTDTGAFVWRNDYWVLAWQLEDDNCTTQAMMETGFMSRLLKGIGGDAATVGGFAAGYAFQMPTVGATGAGLAARQVTRFMDAEEARTDQANRFSVRERRAVARASFQLLGATVLTTLAEGSSRTGFVKCNLNKEAIERSENGRPVEIAIYSDKVEVDLGGGDTCSEPVSSIGCVYSPACAAACNRWAQAARG